MSTSTVDRLHLAVLDGHLMDDRTLARLVPECRSLTAFTSGSAGSDLAQRWAAIAPGTDLVDGGQVADLREAMVECAKRRIVVISTGVPADPASFVALALQGAAAMTEFDVPGVAVHVMRPVERPGSVAWLTDTGELSGYGVLFAVGYAHLHNTSVDLIEPSSGLGRPRTADALDDALAFADAAGVPISRHTDPSPFARVLRDEHCLVVHPVLDAPKGFNLLHPGELSHKAVASGNPAVVVELIEKFPGDVVAVFDGVQLISGSIPAARIAAGVALGVVAAAGIGTMVASPAMADSSSSSTQHSQGNYVEVTGSVPGISWVAIPHSQGSTTLTLSNATGQDIVVRVIGGHGHEGGPEGGPLVIVPAHDYTNVSLGGGIKQWTISPGTHQQSTPQPHVPDGTTHVVVLNESELTVTPGRGPGALVDEKERTTMLQPNAPQQVPQAVPEAIPGPDVPPTVSPQLTPTLVPPVQQQVPEAIPGPDVPPTLTPQLTPTLVPPVQQQVPEAIPAPEQKVDEPVLVPPVRGTNGEITQSSVAAAVTSTVTPEGLVDVSGVVTPGTASDVVTDSLIPADTGMAGDATTTTTPATDTGVGTTVGHGPTTTAHHHASPTGVTGGSGGSAHHAPAGELAHTGGNTAILAIVAGSLLAAGAGLAVAGRMGKDDPDTGVNEG